MKLTELNPKYVSENGIRTHITFDCPKCKEHKIAIPINGEKKWDSFGDNLDSITISPSIAHDNGMGCKSHFFIKNGEIEMV